MEQFEVTFLDDDKITILQKQIVNAGEQVRYQGAIPTKAPTNMMKYTFIGWLGKEKMESVTENLILIAEYEAETVTNAKFEKALLEASLENAQNTSLTATVEAGKKVSEQQNALEKDSRSAEQIVNEILENGKVEVGIETNKDNIER